MRQGTKRFLPSFALIALVFAASAAWGAEVSQSCPTSPGYAPDFTSNQGCITVNGNASFPAPVGSAASITSWAGAGSIVTFQAANSFTLGQAVTLSGFANSTFFNGVTVTVLSTGLSNSQFEVTYSAYSGSSDTGTATPAAVLQVTPNATTQAGSAWFNNQQSVANGFSTTFTFALTNTSTYTADGIAFVIQNNGLSALGPDGCGMGFGGGGCTTGNGIPNSVAVEFNTFANQGYDPTLNDETSNNSVSIQSCGTNSNSINTTPTAGCNYGNNVNLPVTLADGNAHTVTVSYTLQPTASETNCVVDGTPGPCLDVILDGTDLFPAGVSINLSTLLTLTNGSAYVGFTGGTGGGDDTQDILNWTFASQSQSQTQTIVPNTPTTFNFNGGFNEGSPNTGFDSGVTESSSQTVQMVMTATSASSPSCDSLVQASFPGAHCFVYENGGGQGVNAAIMFEITCPPDGSCGSTANPFEANLTSDFTFLCDATDNLPALCGSFGFPNITATSGLPGVGFLKGSGPDPNHPCTPYPNNNPPLFQSNQISSFNFEGDPSSKPIKAGSGGTTSCWVPTYETPGEVPTVTITQPANGHVYQLNESDSTTLANYTCTAVNNGTSATGPYLTVPSGGCTASDSPGGSVNNGGQFDTSNPGPHTFTANVEDSALNTNTSSVTYYVQGSASTIVTSNLNPSVYGQLVGFTATVSSLPSGNGTPTGTVQFVIDGNPYGAPVALSGGSATLSTSTLTAGTHTVSATYSGDNLHTPGTPGVLAGGQVVNQPPAITSASSTGFTLGVLNSFTVTTTGYPIPSSISESGALPNGVNFLNNGNGTATISGIPTQSGTFLITITASNGISPAAVQNFSLVTSGALLSVSPTSYNFGVENLGLDLDPIPVTLKNIGTIPVTINGASITLGPGTKAIDFIPINLCPKSLGVGKSCVVGVVFLAGNVGSLSATLNISDSAPGSPQQVSLAATVINPQIKFSPASLNFNTVKVGQPTTINVTVSNPGTTPLNITNVGVAGVNAKDFMASTNCSTLNPNSGSCTISVTFTPSATGSRNAFLTVTDNAPLGTQLVPLTGKGN